MTGVVGVHSSATHSFSKQSQDAITLLADHGVEGDAHAGATVKHRSRVARDAEQPNLRQVHLMHAELLASLDVAPGALGENITTSGIDLLGLSRGTRLHLGPDAVVEVTGLRNPCVQIDRYRKGLLAQVLGRAEDGSVVRRAGVMSVVLAGGVVRPGDAVVVEAPEVHVPLEVV
ncbi:MAG TPA: MOSC domain-containing protein [Mycobacteriales bacterium]|nr:MOSC domain-containing protein [Mycobacteriales bacterium]